ncbi:MAG TPA: C45 family peptidase [Thermomicrobiales bacterium]|nr:C45 family peptidase [Thermomicrobiales bacterium]
MTAVERNRELLVVDAAGAPRDLGRRHGETARPLIAAGLDRWFAAIERRHRVPATAYIDQFLAETDFLPTIETWTPELLEEIRGVAEGAGQPLPTMLAFNLLDEEWAYAHDRARPAPGCSAVGIQPAPGRPTLLGQTMDIPQIHDGCQIALRLAPDDRPALVVLSYAGMIGLTGANEAGLGVVVNSLATLPVSRRGLPVAFVLRGVLAWTNLADAAAFVRSVPHAIGQHYGIGSPDGIRSFEGWGDGVVETTPDGPRVLHTNHPLGGQSEVGDRETIYAGSTTWVRLACLRRQAATLTDRIALETALSDTSAPISVAPRPGFMTFGATSMKLIAPPEIRIAPGPPHLTPFVDVPMPVRSAVAAD